MDYEQKYKEALERAKGVIEQNPLMEYLKKGIEYILPELKESEDEKSKKWILEYLHDGLRKSDEQFKDHFKAAIAWLEKQGEKPQGKSALEAISEEKVDNANKVEHKFNEGDWVVNRENKIVQIKALKKDKYNVLRYCIEWKDGKKTNPLQYYTDNYCHLWTLSDVKNGDILHSSSLHLIWIYKDNETAHICVNMNYVKDNVFTEGSIVIPEDACPANKLQRDILFSKIKEAGYEWDADKKELKKIEQKSVEWSEEDENLLKLSFENLTELKDMYGEEYGKVGNCISWLKSLKQRYTWKPSNEQMIALNDAILLNEEDHYNGAVLSTLLEQLKKLK